jgi:hypothetical protein
LKGQFSEVLTLFLRKDLNQLMGNDSQLSCKKCGYVDEKDED